MTAQENDIKYIKSMVKNMEIVEKFLGNKGLFTGEFVKISIKDLAKIISNKEKPDDDR